MTAAHPHTPFLGQCPPRVLLMNFCKVNIQQEWSGTKFVILWFLNCWLCLSKTMYGFKENQKRHWRGQWKHRLFQINHLMEYKLNKFCLRRFFHHFHTAHWPWWFPHSHCEVPENSLASVFDDLPILLVMLNVTHYSKRYLTSAPTCVWFASIRSQSIINTFEPWGVPYHNSVFQNSTMLEPLIRQQGWVIAYDSTVYHEPIDLKRLLRAFDWIVFIPN